MSAGTFTPGADGLSRVHRTVALDAPPAALAVTLEPEGGVPAPTGPKVMLAAGELTLDQRLGASG